MGGISWLFSLKRTGTRRRPSVQSHVVQSAKELVSGHS